MLAFPITFMNDSGQAVSALVRRYRIESPEQIIVVQDELDLPPGDLKVKAGGGLAGHNGLRSIKQHLKTEDFLRVRIGVGKPPSKEAGAGHVLSKVPKAERELLDIRVVDAADAVELIIAERSRCGDAALQWQAMTPAYDDCTMSRATTAPLGSLPQLLRDEPGPHPRPRRPERPPRRGRSRRGRSRSPRSPYLSSSRPLIVTCPTGTMAGQLADDLRQFLPADEVVHFPGWETLPFERVSPSVETMGHRLEILWRLRDPQRVPAVIVTGVRALLQKLGPGATTIEPVVVRPGAEIDPDELSRDASSSSGTAARNSSSTAASSPGAARSSTCIPRPPTPRSASTCGATRSTG